MKKRMRKHWERKLMVGMAGWFLLSGSAVALAEENPNSPLYERTITGDETQDAAWKDSGVASWGAPEADGSTKATYKFTTTDDQSIKPAFAAGAGKPYAVINPRNPLRNITLENKEQTFRIQADGSSLSKPEIYAIYNTGGEIELDGYRTTYEISVDAPDDAAGAVVYAGVKKDAWDMDGAAAPEEKAVKSTVFRSGGMGAVHIRSESPGIVGIEAGKGGVAYFWGNGDDKVETKGNYALKAQDGGRIFFDGSVTAVDHAAIYAGKGGEVHLGYMLLNAEKNKTMASSEANLTGDVVSDTGGLVNLHLKKALWQGSKTGTGTFKATLAEEGVWSGGADKIDALTMQRGGLWRNLSAGKTNIVSLYGDEGTIDMEKAGHLDVYEFHGALSLQYAYDDQKKDFIGGKTLIYKAFSREGNKAYLNLIADGSRIAPAESAALMGKLAQKLTYGAYITGERNLEGQVTLLEGLTTPQKIMRLSPTNFDPNTGVAGIEERDVMTFHTAITGDAGQDAEYHAAHVTSDSVTFNFTKDTEIRTRYDRPQSDPLAKAFSGSVLVEDGKTITLNMNGKDLTLRHDVAIGDMVQHTSAGLFVTKRGSLTINNPGAIRLGIEADYYYAGGIGAGYRGSIPAGDPPSEVIINNDDDPAHAVVIRGKMNTGGTFDINFTGLKAFAGGLIRVKGLVDIQSGHAWGLSASDKKAVVSVGGGRIIAKDYSALDAYGKGTVNVNVVGTGSGMQAGRNPVYLIGAAQPFGAYIGEWDGGFINIGLNTPDSYWQGTAIGKYSTWKNIWIGETRLFLGNGAVWNNAPNDWTADSPIEKAKKDEHKSRLVRLTGGATKEAAGVIRQNTMQPIQIDKYSGHTLVLYQHGDQKTYDYFGNVTGVTKDVVIGGDLKILSAEPASYITLRIGNQGIDTGNESTVRDWLGKLANKIYYIAYKTNERNLTVTAEIGEGLTTRSAAWLRRGDVEFKADTGQGFLAGGTPPASQTIEQTAEAFGAKITGVRAQDDAYVQANVLKGDGGHYVFQKDSVISGMDEAVDIGDIDHAVTIDSRENTLSLKGKRRAVNVTSTQGVDITAKALLAAAESDTGPAAAIQVGNAKAFNKLQPHRLTIDGPVTAAAHGADEARGLSVSGNAEVTINGRVTMRGDIGQEYGVGLKSGGSDHTSAAALYGEGNPYLHAGARVKINGDVDLKVDANGVLARGSGTNFDIAGGRVEVRRDNTMKYFALLAESATINLNVQRDAAGMVTGAGTHSVTVRGNVGTLPEALDASDEETYTRVNLGLATPDSSWTGLACNGFNEAGHVLGSKTFRGEINLVLSQGATWTNEAYGALPTSLSADQQGSHLARLFGGASAAQAGVIRQNDARAITVDDYSGHTMVLYAHDAANPTSIQGGDVRIRRAAPGSSITLRTDSGGLNVGSTAAIDKNKVSATLNALAQKLFYSAYKDGENHLQGKAEIAEGLTTSSASLSLAAISYRAENGQGQYLYTPETEPPPPSPGPGPGPTPGPGPMPPIIYGPEETAIMKGTKTAILSGAMVFRANNNDLERRMGDIRLSDSERGAWFKYLGGKLSMTDQNVDLDQRYHLVQVGYDRDVADWTVGLAVDYGKAKGDYQSGSSDVRLGSLALYGIRQESDGSYLDMILRASRVQGDYDVTNGLLDLSGRYQSWGYSFSAEYGRRIVQESGFYIDPSVELTMGHLNGGDYTAQGGGGTLHIHQDDFNSFVGRLGIGVGQETERSNVFLKVAVVHEFAGAFDTRYWEDGLPEKRTALSLKDTWLDLELGGSVMLSDNTYFYANYTKTFSTERNKQWRVDAGLRVSF